MASDLELVQEKIREFSNLRDWSQFHTAKNLILAVSAEIGELAEVLLWKSDSEVENYLKTSEGINKISEEIADVAIYLLRLCQQLNIDFIDILNKKMEINSTKYPVDKSKGKAVKYTDLDN
jgi:NTP pyrophosphatase (non-canonical NTP hydrolase)